MNLKKINDFAVLVEDLASRVCVYPGAIPARMKVDEPAFHRFDMSGVEFALYRAYDPDAQEWAFWIFGVDGPRSYVARLKDRDYLTISKAWTDRFHARPQPGMPGSISHRI